MSASIFLFANNFLIFYIKNKIHVCFKIDLLSVYFIWNSFFIKNYKTKALKTVLV